MESYTIHFTFRSRQLTALVNAYDTHSFIYLKDEDLLQEYGGKLEYDHATETFKAVKMGNEFYTLSMAVKNQLR